MGSRFAALEQFIQDKMAETHLPAVSIALIERGETIYQRGFGFRDSARGLSATPQTLYGIGSVTKSFTCLAIMQLQEQGKLNVQDQVDRYVPLEIRPEGKPIRLHHFMTHSSGIPALAYAEAVIRHAVGAADKWLPIATYDDMLTFVNGAQDWIQAAPGERWFYLNEGYILLGAIIEKVSGQPYVEYVQEHILDPLGMNRSFFRNDQVEADSDAAVPYVITKDKTHIPSHYLYGRLSSDGGLISNVEDMSRYLAMYLANGRGPEGKVISPESLRAMTTPYVALVPEVYPASESIPIGHAGYGLFVYPNFFDHTLIGHGGAVLVSTAHLAFIPDREIGVIVLANGSGYAMGHFANAALAVMLGKDPWTLPGVASERSLEQLAGRYETYQGTYGATVKRAGDFLMLEIKNKLLAQTLPLVPVALDTSNPKFFTLSLGRRIPVEFYLDGGRTELIYERYKMRRVGEVPES